MNETRYKLPCYQWKSFVTASHPCSTCLLCFLTGPITHLLYMGLTSVFFFNLFFFILQHCFVCLGGVVCAVLPSSSLPFPPLSKHLWAAAGLFYATPRVQVAEPKSYPTACVSGDEGKEEVGQGVNAPGCWRMMRTDPLQAQSECRLNVLLLYLQQPPLLQPTITTHTYRHYVRTCSSHLKLTHLPLEDCWHNFSTSLCVILVLPSPSYLCL